MANDCLLTKAQASNVVPTSTTTSPQQTTHAASMIQPQWLRRTATAISHFSSPTRNFSRTPTTTQADPQWPLLRKRSRPSNEDTIHSGGTSLIESLKSRQPIAADTSPSSPDHPSSTSDSRPMLILHGLSPNLNASDFYRLAPSDLSSWQSVIKKVQQQRNPVTLEPLGRYHISFSSSVAAISYRDRLLRLHKLAHHKLRSPSGLWESSIPKQLLSPSGDDAGTELEAFTATSGTQSGLDIQRRRVAVKNKWAQKLGGIVKRFGYGEKPPVVLVHVYPPTLTAADLAGFIRDDGLARGCEWKVCLPQDLPVTPNGKPTPTTTTTTTTTIHEGHDEPVADARPPTQSEIDNRDKLKSRFVVVCANEAEARRFHRHWNQRTLTAGPEDSESMRNIVHASIINW